MAAVEVEGYVFVLDKLLDPMVLVEVSGGAEKPPRPVLALVVNVLVVDVVVAAVVVGPNEIVGTLV